MSASARSDPAPRHFHLRDMRPGDRARIVACAVDSPYGCRLQRFGLTPGTLLELKRFAPLGDPAEIRFRNYSLLLRPSEADCLLLEKP